MQKKLMKAKAKLEKQKRGRSKKAAAVRSKNNMTTVSPTLKRFAQRYGLKISRFEGQPYIRFGTQRADISDPLTYDPAWVDDPARVYNEVREKRLLDLTLDTEHLHDLSKVIGFETGIHDLDADGIDFEEGQERILQGKWGPMLYALGFQYENADRDGVTFRFPAESPQAAAMALFLAAKSDDPEAAAE